MCPPHTKLYPAADLEGEVMRLVDGVLSDPDKITREVDETIERERASLRDPNAMTEFWADKIADCERRRTKNQEMYRADAMSLDELKADNARIEGEHEAAQVELARVQDASARVDELEERRTLILSLFGTGLQLGMAYLPPEIRHATYGLLGLQVTVEPGGVVSIGGVLDAGVVELSRDVEEYVDALQSVGGTTRAGTTSPPSPHVSRRSASALRLANTETVL
jgi:hypothetical protein